MISITPLHSRLNVIPRPDIANAMHGVHVGAGAIDNALWGKVRVESPISYSTPAPRDSFAFGQVASIGLPGVHGPRASCVVDGDIIGFDLWQIGHEVPGDAFYGVRSFYTLPWAHALCRFPEGSLVPTPLGDWLMVEPDDVSAMRWLAGSDGTLTLPGSMRGAVGTNRNQKTRVRLTVGKVLSAGGHANASMVSAGMAEGSGWHALYNPLDAVTIDLPGIGKRAFVTWENVENAVTL